MWIHSVTMWNNVEQYEEGTLDVFLLASTNTVEVQNVQIMKNTV